VKRIELIEPADGFVTPPLQKHTWPPEREVGSGKPAGVFDWDNLQIVGMDRSQPHPVLLTWRRPGLGFGHITYSVALSLSPDLADSRVITTSKTKAEFWHPFLGRKYYWKVSALRFGKIQAESPVWSFTTDPTPPRWIRVPGMTNMRDIGGWPLQGGRP